MRGLSPPEYGLRGARLDAVRRCRDTPGMLSDDSLDLLFRNGRTHRAWHDRPVPDALLRHLYQLASLGPTSGNCSPMRVLFAKTREAKERLRSCLAKVDAEFFPDEACRFI